MVPLLCDKFQSGGVGGVFTCFFLNLLLPDFDLTFVMDVELFATLSKLADDMLRTLPCTLLILINKTFCLFLDALLEWKEQHITVSLLLLIEHADIFFFLKILLNYIMQCLA